LAGPIADLAFVADPELALTGAVVLFTGVGAAFTTAVGLEVFVTGAALLLAPAALTGTGVDFGPVMALGVVLVLGVSTTFFCVPTLLLVVVIVLEGVFAGAE